MSEEIKGIMHLDAESEDFTKKVKTDKEESLGIKASMDWELDRVTLSVKDKNDNCIASLVFDNSDFQSAADKVMPPSLAEEKEPTEEEKKKLEEEGKEAMEDVQKNPIKKEIEGYFE